MRVYISADIEGITGLVSWRQCSEPAATIYDWSFARRMYAHDVNAAIRGARAAGAEDVVVKDSHGRMKNLLIDELEPGVELVSGNGFGQDGMMEGIATGRFDAAILVGYHAMAGTPCGIMDHTYNAGGIHRVSVNGRQIGEMALSMALAGKHGTPIVAVTSDAAGCREAAEFVPGIATASVKEGLGRFGARLMHPADTRVLIENTVGEGVGRKGAIKPFTFGEPIRLEVEFHRGEQADLCESIGGAKRTDGYTVEHSFDSFAEAHSAFLRWSTLAGVALTSQAP